MNAMGAASDVVWVLMPGNYDHTNATALWRQVTQDAPSNVTVLLSLTPFLLADGAVLLPEPPSERHPGRDLKEWFDSADTVDAVRIGIAHGSVTDFQRSEDGGSSIIPIDRARRAGLAYLGLGDWHGQVQISPETWYSGAPEADSFKHTKSPSALLVEVEGSVHQPRSLPCPPVIIWHRAHLELSVSVSVVE